MTDHAIPFEEPADDLRDAQAFRLDPLPPSAAEREALELFDVPGGMGARLQLAQLRPLALLDLAPMADCGGPNPARRSADALRAAWKG